MPTKFPQALSAAVTLRAAGAITRRSLLKAGAATAAIAATGPAFIRKARATSGELNVMFWSDELPPDFLKAFTAKTGITVNFTGFGSNEELLSKLKETKGQGFDLVSPTLNRSLQWQELDMLQPFDLKKVPVDRVNPSMVKAGAESWNFNNKGQHWLPHVWGTEGIAWRTDKWKPTDGTWPSYGDIWDDANAGKSMGRAHSMLLGAGLYLEHKGVLPAGSIWKAYKSEADMKPVWDTLIDWCIKRKKNIKVIWNDADTQKNGLTSGDIILGQTWDGPVLALKSEGQPVMYRAPSEGAIAWVDGMAMPIGAKNIDQVYAFIDFDYTPEQAGKAIDVHNYNSPVIGADKFANEKYAKNFADAYPGDALQRLNPWPAEATWYADLRGQYVNKFLSA